MTHYQECTVAKTDRSYMPHPYTVLSSYAGDLRERLDEEGTRWKTFSHFYVSSSELLSSKPEEFRRQVAEAIDSIIVNSKRKVTLRGLRKRLNSNPRFVTSKKPRF